MRMYCALQHSVWSRPVAILLFMPQHMLQHDEQGPKTQTHYLTTLSEVPWKYAAIDCTICRVMAMYDSSFRHAT